MPTTHQILDKVRDACGLRVLEFGCEVESNFYGRGRIVKNKGSELFIVEYPSHRIEVETLQKPTDFEIIGLTPQWHHLVWSIGKNSKRFCAIKQRDNEDYGFLMVDDDSFKVNLTKPLKDNLDGSEELRRVVGELLGITD